MSSPEPLRVFCACGARASWDELLGCWSPCTACGRSAPAAVERVLGPLGAVRPTEAAPRCPRCDAYLLLIEPFAGCARCGWEGLS